MRLRFAVLAAAMAALAGAAVPSIAGAAPHSNRALTIHATPSHIIAGEPVLIFGRLEGRGSANQVVHLWHRINPATRFTIIGTTKTDSAGRYEFTRAEGVVNSNRNWFVRGPVFTHSRTIHERVAAEVTISPSANEGTTRHAFTFTGHVTPGHAGSRVALQEQRGASDDWTTIKTGRVGPGSNYSIDYAWRTAGPRDVRVAFAGDNRNTAAVSDAAAIVVDQRQAPYFTIDTSAAIVANGTSATISGTLDKPGTSVAEPGATVSLFARQPGTQPFAVQQTTTTGSAGEYSFTVQDTTNELYQARTTVAPVQSSAVVFQGVQDALTMSSSSATSTVDGMVTFSGTVAPSKVGHVIYLQKLGRDGEWHTVETSTVTPSSTFSFGWTFGTAGTKQFRARITGDPANVGGASAPVSVAVSQPPLSTLPTS